MASDTDKLLEVRNSNEEWLNAIPGVRGSGVGINAKRSGIAIKVYDGGITGKNRTAITKRFSPHPVEFEPDPKPQAK